MEPVSALVGKAKLKGTEGETARKKLRHVGAKAAPAIVEGIRMSSPQDVRLLSNLLLSMRDADLTPFMLTLLNDMNVSVKLMAHESLAKLRDPRALGPLSDQLFDPNNLEFTKSLAARVLGDIGQVAATDALQRAAEDLVSQTLPLDAEEARLWVERETDDDRLGLAIEIAIALAKLGSNELLSVILAIIQTRIDKVSDDDLAILTSQAIVATIHVVGRGVFHALQLAVRSAHPETRAATITPLRYLGTKEVLPELIVLVKDESQSVSDEALAAIHGVTGEWPNQDEPIEEIDLPFLRRWWNQRQARYEPFICYRLGEPISLLQLLSLAETQADRSEVLAELRVITGEDFSDLDSVDRQRWYVENRGRFAVGQLYKYGRKQDLARIFD